MRICTSIINSRVAYYILPPTSTLLPYPGGTMTKYKRIYEIMIAQGKKGKKTLVKAIPPV